MKAVLFSLPFSAFEELIAGTVLCVETDNLARTVKFMIAGGHRLPDFVAPPQKLFDRVDEIRGKLHELQFQAFLDESK